MVGIIIILSKIISNIKLITESATMICQTCSWRIQNTQVLSLSTNLPIYQAKILSVTITRPSCALGSNRIRMWSTRMKMKTKVQIHQGRTQWKSIRNQTLQRSNRARCQIWTIRKKEKVQIKVPPRLNTARTNSLWPPYMQMI